MNRWFIRALLWTFFMFVMILTGCTAPRSGGSYEKDVLSKLNERYGIEFTVIDRLDKNEDNYNRLLISPKDNNEVIFFAEKYDKALNGSGGFPTYGLLNEDYAVAHHAKLLSSLYLKYFNKRIDDDVYKNYFEAKKNDQMINYWDYLLKTQLVLEMTKDNLKEQSDLIEAIIKEMKQQHPYNIKYIDAFLPYRFSDIKYPFDVPYAHRVDDGSSNVYNTLASTWKEYKQLEINDNLEKLGLKSTALDYFTFTFDDAFKPDKLTVGVKNNRNETRTKDILFEEFKKLLTLIDRELPVKELEILVRLYMTQSEESTPTTHSLTLKANEWPMITDKEQLFALLKPDNR